MLEGHRRKRDTMFGFTGKDWAVLAGVAVGVGLGLPLAVGATYEGAGAEATEVREEATEAQMRHVATFTTPCEDDGDIGCVWVADVMGDGHGASYWADEQGNQMNLSHWDAAYLLENGDLPVTRN